MAAADGEHIDLGSLIPMLQQRGSVVLLESQSYAHPAARKTFLAAHPLATLKAYGNRVICKRAGKTIEKKDADPWKELKRFRELSGGWLFGYLGYDLKNNLEQLSSENPDPVGAPDLFMMDPGLLIEITPGGWTVLKGEISPENFNIQGEHFTKGYSIDKFVPKVREQDYLGMIRRAKEDIRDGQYYEINLSHQMSGLFSGEPFALYRDMKQAGPVPFGAYLFLGGTSGEFSICSASPERFLAKEDNRVFSQPIKGTIHRGATKLEDRELKQWLKASDKNKAENLMIVDLVRNDLGRIAQPGSVKVSNLFEVQSFETVHQMVSTVEAIAGDQNPVDIIKACFPMGSMTGAPKIRAMRAIEELENYRRGIYSGAIGYLTPGGDFDFNVVIRTAIINRDQLFYSVGGAITSDSHPQEEWKETLVKAKALTLAVPKDEKFE